MSFFFTLRMEDYSYLGLGMFVSRTVRDWGGTIWEGEMLRDFWLCIAMGQEGPLLSLLKANMKGPSTESQSQVYLWDIKGTRHFNHWWNDYLTSRFADLLLQQKGINNLLPTFLEARRRWVSLPQIADDPKSSSFGRAAASWKARGYTQQKHSLRRQLRESS